jgi:hypothetical protein
MHSLSTPFVLGYHGCDYQTAEAVLSGRQHLKLSDSDYDWLGAGVYFWEADPNRGLEWAKEQAAKRKYNNPCVLGAVIHLGHCLNFMTRQAIMALKKTHEGLITLGQPLPENTGHSYVRKLDCFVIEALHRTMKKRGLQEYNTVRGLFTEGDPIYKTAGFHEKTHIQLCIRDVSAIKGYFRVLPEHLDGGE